ncbi:MAG: response regulator transcription factor [Pseudomonadota bacterium]
MNIWIVDDHQLFSSGLASLLEHQKANLGTAIFDRVEDMPSIHGGMTPDVVILDFYMPGTHGGAAIRDIRAHHPQAQIVVVSASHSPEDRREAEVAGAVAFLSKSSNPQNVIEAVLSVARGEPVHVPHNPSDPETRLTKRQLAVLGQIRRGASNKLAGTKLGMSPETVKSHLSETFRRLGVATRTEAVDAAIRQGLL